MTFLLRPARFASAFSPDDIASLQYWFDPSEAANRTDDGTNVTQLTNKAASGSTYNAQVGATNASAPLLATGAINRRDALEFDNSLRVLSVSAANAPHWVEDGPWRMFVVFRTKPSSLTSSNNWLLYNGLTLPGSGQSFIRIRKDTANDIDGTSTDQDDGDRTSEQIQDATVAPTDWLPHIAMLGREKGTGSGGVDRLRLMVDDAEVPGSPRDMAASHDWSSPGTGSVTGFRTAFVVGGRPANSTTAADGTNFLQDCYVGEVLFFDGDLTAQQEQDVYDYLAGKWMPTFQPSDISDLIAWWDPSVEESVTVSGSAVTRIDAVPAGSITPPLLQANSIYQPVETTINGLNAISFDSDCLNSNSNAALNPLGDDFTMVIVMQRPDPASSTARCIIDIGSSGATHAGLVFVSGSPGELNFNLNTGTVGSSAITSGGTYNDDAPHILIAVRSGTNAFLYDETGSEVATVAIGSGSYSATQFNYGSWFQPGDGNWQPYEGVLGECLYYGKALSSSERTSVIDYLKSKWGVT